MAQELAKQDEEDKDEVDISPDVAAINADVLPPIHAKKIELGEFEEVAGDKNDVSVPENNQKSDD